MKTIIVFTIVLLIFFYYYNDHEVNDIRIQSQLLFFVENLFYDADYWKFQHDEQSGHLQYHKMSIYNYVNKNYAKICIS